MIFIRNVSKWYGHFQVLANCSTHVEKGEVVVALAKEGMTMICVTHEIGFARKVAHRVVFIDHGGIIEDSGTEEFFDQPRSERAQQFLSKILRH